jgi:RsiW-degrading membrane proteinase PrsW (M82 family)
MKYRYIIYKIYSWKNDTPIGNTILTLATVHFFHVLTILTFIDAVVTPLKLFSNINKTYLFVGAIIYFILFYFLVYDKKRWDSYIKEFENENEKERKRGNVIVISFLIGSILLYLISLPVFYTIGKKISH